MIYKSLRITNPILACLLAFALALSPVRPGSAQAEEPHIRRVPSMEAGESGSVHPAGLAFSSDSEKFYVLEAPGQEIIEITSLADQRGSTSLAAVVEDPLNVVFDNQNNRLLAYQAATAELLEVPESSNGNLERTTVIRHNAQRFGIQNPQGLAIDEEKGGLFLLDVAGPRIVRVQLGSGGNVTGGGISVIDLGATGLISPRGIAFDPTTGHLHVFDLIDQQLYELTQSGQVVTTRSLVPFGLKSPQGMVFAPSGDQTDDPSQTSLFLADSGLISGRASRVSGSAPSTGQILELSLVQPAAAAATTSESSLVQVTDMSTLSPPGPDPSGIAFLPLSSRLMVVDGEVDETISGTTHFEGANVWELTQGGSLIRTANISPVSPTSVPMSDEPTGVAWNPNNGHYYFSDDTGSTDLYDLNPGADELVGTSDDSWVGYPLSSYGVGDAEGIAYDTGSNSLFVADGVNAEVYQFTLTGTLIDQFDVLTYGVVDPEAVEFNSNSGTLFIMSSDRSTGLIIETTTSGELLQTIDISSANIRTAAGLAYAPASNGSDAMSFYIVDRGVDNDSNPDLIDGKLYELTAPTSGPTPTPSNTPTPTNTFTPGPSPTSTPITDLIFADSFETGDFSVWTSSTTGNGDLSVSTQSALVGSHGMQATINDTSPLYVSHVLPSAESRYRARFYFDPNSISMTDGNSHYICIGFDTTAVFNVEFRLSGGNYEIRLRQQNDSQGTQSTSWFFISDAPHFIEIEWIAATGAGANNGGVTLWIDDIQRGTLSGLDNDTRSITSVRLGAIAGIDAGTSGVYYLDAFESRRETYIGPADTPQPTPTDTPLATVTPTATPTNTALPTATDTPTNEPTGTPTNTPLPTATQTDTPTNTPLPKTTDTPTATPTETPTPTSTAIDTATVTPLPTATATDTPTATPIDTATPTPTHTPTMPSSNNALYLSFASNGTIGGVAFADDDILRFDGQNWSLFFDGSDVGVGSLDLFAFSILDADTLLMSFNNAITLNGMSVTPRDVVRFDAASLGSVTSGTFSMYLNGIDVGMDVNAENIDSVVLLPNGQVLISTTGRPALPGVSGLADEDILAFIPVTLGDSTSGTWTLYFDGSDVGLSTASSEDVDAMDVDPNGNIYLSTLGNFAVTGISGFDEDVFVCTPTSLGSVTACNYSSSLYFDGDAWGLSANDIDALTVLSTGPLPTNTPTSTPDGPTNTPTNTPTSTATNIGPSPTPTNTSTPTHTPVNTPTATNTPISTGMTLAAVADARVLQSNPTTNYGTIAKLNVDSPGEESYIRFTVSGVNGTIQNATLRLFVTNGSSNGPSIYGTDNSWSESAITWNNRPAPTTGVLDNLGTATAGTWVEYNVTTYITGNGTYNFVLLPDSSAGIAFYSREGSSPPQLVLTLSP